ncbi:MarR family winged helix-turn-helix transcriptional regulator [Streptomyces sp. NBC_01803]|uniref:MarR family winged helix-turn-helix transcriptional regulator n=1 Tax=Streptomyces sp. NBC_01803 TaxID=2975946 RepID=UPI002DD9736D|nr:MarR family transcriptional regulator [Streptomyces sp. NBC_01803]WSA45199.1 MarR family transcriptional regulator [Streptomyces sp. NBC_01803]
MSRADRLAEIRRFGPRHLASYALFNQAVADHLGLHPTDVQCLRLISMEPGPFTTRRVAEVTGVTSSAASRLLDRLERAGYLTRRRDEHDRRRTLVSLVPEAERRLESLWDYLGEAFEARFEDNSDEELAVVVEYMRRSIELANLQIERLRGLAPG